MIALRKSAADATSCAVARLACEHAVGEGLPLDMHMIALSTHEYNQLHQIELMKLKQDAL